MVYDAVRLIRRLEKQREKFLRGSSMSHLALEELLFDWLTRHIIENDIKLADFLNR